MNPYYYLYQQEQLEAAPKLDLLCTSNPLMTLEAIIEEEDERAHASKQPPEPPKKEAQDPEAADEEEVRKRQKRLLDPRVKQEEQRREIEFQHNKLINTADTISHFTKGKKPTEAGERPRPSARMPERKAIQLKVFRRRNVEPNESVDVRRIPRDLRIRELVHYMQREPLFKHSQVLYKTLMSYNL